MAASVRKVYLPHTALSESSYGSSSSSPNKPSTIDHTPLTDSLAQYEDGEVHQMSGYLWKLSTRGYWQQRYFETNGSYLTYYKSEDMDKLMAAINMPQVGEIKILNEIDDSQGYGIIFVIELKDRQFQLRVESKFEADRWVKHLIYLRDGPARTHLPGSEHRSASTNIGNPLFGAGFVESNGVYTSTTGRTTSMVSMQGGISDARAREPSRFDSTARYVSMDVMEKQRTISATLQKSSRSRFACCFRTCHATF